jgi:hypothetical protein
MRVRNDCLLRLSTRLRFAVCPNCLGRLREPSETCNGDGVKRFLMLFERDCSVCQGSGETLCRRCQASGPATQTRPNRKRHQNRVRHGIRPAFNTVVRRLPRLLPPPPELGGGGYRGTGAGRTLPKHHRR